MDIREEFYNKVVTQCMWLLDPNSNNYIAETTSPQDPDRPLVVKADIERFIGPRIVQTVNDSSKVLRNLLEQLETAGESPDFTPPTELNDTPSLHVGLDDGWGIYERAQAQREGTTEGYERSVMGILIAILTYDSPTMQITRDDTNERQTLRILNQLEYVLNVSFFRNMRPTTGTNFTRDGGRIAKTVLVPEGARVAKTMPISVFTARLECEIEKPINVFEGEEIPTAM